MLYTCLPNVCGIAVVSIEPWTYEIFINVSHSTVFTVFHFINKNKSSAKQIKSKRINQ